MRSASGAQEYGKVTFEGQTLRVHRAVFEAVYGYRPHVIMHSCDNGLCFRPDHLHDGNQRLNIQDCVARGRHYHASRTRCPRGHEYTDDNTYVASGTGYRQCKTCARANSVERAKVEKMQRQLKLDLKAGELANATEVAA